MVVFRPLAVLLSSLSGAWGPSSCVVEASLPSGIDLLSEVQGWVTPMDTQQRGIYFSCVGPRKHVGANTRSVLNSPLSLLATFFSW